MKAYSRFLDVLEKIEKAILVITIALMVLVMLYQVILRYVFSQANSWSEELTRYLFILNVMLASAIAVRRNSHLQIDILLNKMKPKTRAVFTLISTLVGLVFMGYLLKASIDICFYTQRNISAGLHISMSIPYAVIPVGVALMMLASVEVILKNIHAITHRMDSEGEVA